MYKQFKNQILGKKKKPETIIDENDEKVNIINNKITC